MLTMRRLSKCFVILASLTLCSITHAMVPNRYFEIDVIDDQTGRGVPLVELRTVNEVRYYTDSAGVIAVDDPELMGRSVYFAVSSPGYTYPADAFGYSGVALKVAPGGKATAKIHRTNIAERLYRITGAGIYRDSVLVGRSVPIKHPLLDGQVFGQDTVMVTPYRGRLIWLWGDTQRPSYPLGQFATSGAMSLMPGHGGLDPSRGVDLTYWVGPDGFSRPMLPIAGATGPVWVGGTFTLRENGAEHLYTHYAEVDKSMAATLSGLAEFDDHAGVFKSIHQYDVTSPLIPNGEPFLVDDDATRYLYFETTSMGAFPLVRNVCKIDQMMDSSAYEGFTCLVPGTRFDGANTKLERSGDGRLIWRWKRNTPALGEDQANTLVDKGLMRRDELLTSLHDVDTDAVVLSHGGTVYWNEYRRKWIMITTQAYGNPSFLGEVWFAEADTPVGPWLYAKKIATHNNYTFYNPAQHPFFDQEGGRLIYFEGTYTSTFSDVKDITPRYDYNQLMYRLDLADKRLALPAPVYRLNSDGHYRYGQREQISPDPSSWSKLDAIPFYAVPVSGNHDGLIPICCDDSAADAQLSAKGVDGKRPLFYALPAQPGAGEKTPPEVTPIYEYTDSSTGRRWYAAESGKSSSAASRSATATFRAWRNPSSNLTFDFGAYPYLNDKE